MRQFDIQKLDALVDAGKLMRQVHPTLPLRIYKYTPELQFASEWDDLTVRCRGLVVDEQGYQYSNPIPKFHNVEELQLKGEDAIPWTLPYEITDKVDGSCIEVFWYKDELVVCTLGSFESDQAKIAKEMLNEYQGQFDALFDRQRTYIFELIVPENRIVLDYGTERSLVLLAIRHNETDEDFLPDGSCFPMVEVIDKTIEEILLEKKREDFINKEGFVVKFSNGFRMKVKYEEYFRLHKIMTGVNEKFIWEFLRDEKPLPLENVPDEFFNYVTEVKERLEREFFKLKYAALDAFRSLNHGEGMTRKEFALKALQFNFSSVLFKMLENKEYSQIIWKMIEPKSTDKPKFNSFRGVSDDGAQKL